MGEHSTKNAVHPLVVALTVGVTPGAQTMKEAFIWQQEIF